MITKEKTDRINELAKKKREEGLTEEETIEQQKLELDQLKEELERLKNLSTVDA